MLLPTKHISPSRAVIATGARILERLDRGMPPGVLYNQFLDQSGSKVAFTEFVTALSFLYMMGLVDVLDGELLVTRDS
jgi:hypothetical protein